MFKKRVIYLSTFNKTKNSGIFYRQFINKNNFVEIKEVEMNLKKINFFYYLKLFKKLKKIINKDDIIHSQYGSACGLIGSFFPNKKIITLRGSDIQNNGLIEDFYSFLVNKLTLLYLNKYNFIIVVSKKIKKKLIKNKIKKKIIFLPSPVDQDKFFRISRVEAKKILNLKLSKKYIFFPVINHKIKNKNYNFILNLKNRLKKENIHLLTANNKYNQKKMNLLFNACDCTVLVSNMEGWPNVIKESIFCDTPIVSTNVSDLKLLALKSKYIQICNLDIEEFYNKIQLILKFKRPNNLKKMIYFCKLKYHLDIIKSLYNKI